MLIQIQMDEKVSGYYLDELVSTGNGSVGKESCGELDKFCFIRARFEK